MSKVYRGRNKQRYNENEWENITNMVDDMQEMFQKEYILHTHQTHHQQISTKNNLTHTTIKAVLSSKDTNKITKLDK